MNASPAAPLQLLPILLAVPYIHLQIEVLRRPVEFATDPALQFARELAAQAAKFAAEVERLHARPPGPDGEATQSEAEAGKAA